jgi:hypothetical protein
MTQRNLGTSRSVTLRAKNKLWDDRRLSARQVAQSAIKEMPDSGTLDLKGETPIAVSFVTNHFRSPKMIKFESTRLSMVSSALSDNDRTWPSESIKAVKLLLYGTAQHRGILAGLALLKLYTVSA